MARLSKTGGRASKAKARRASQAKGRKTTKTPPNDKRRRNAGRETGIARLKRELKEALARQTATAEILRVISQSPTDVRPVFDAIVLTALRLFRCDLSFMMLCDHTNFWVAAAATPEGLFDDLTLIKEPIDPSANFPSRAIVGKQLLYLPDWSLIDLPEHERQIHETIGVNSALYLPLLREGDCIGLLTVGGKRPGSFGESEIALAESFRDQALIAIENARLFNETKEALERQTATADILRVISDSPADVQPVFQAIAEHARLLCKAQVGATTRLEGDTVHLAGVRSMSADAEEAMRSSFPMPLKLASPNIRRAIIEQVPIQIPDVHLDSDYAHLVDGTQRMGFRSIMSVPLMHEGRSIGTIGVAREEPGLFPVAAVSLLQTFADQAVIAIENARLFNETKEALERQTATADILKVIANSPTNVQPVFEAIAERSKRLVDALSTTVFRLEDGVMHLRAFTPTNPEADATLKAMFPAPLSNFSWSEAIGNGGIYRVVDTELEIEGLRELARLRGFRSMLFVPLLRDRKPIGVISVTRVEPGPFVEHHVQLLQTFADQAVIAIENVRLFDEVQAKTRDLTESLQQQTATAEVLKVISRSAFDLDVVLNSLTKSAVELCNSTYGAISLYRDGVLVFMAQTGCTPEFAELLWSNPARLDRKSATGRAGLLRAVVQVPDVMQDEDYDYHGGEIIGNYRSIFGVPLLRNGELEGVFTLMRREPGNFTPRQIELVQTFADQAVIAIENVRLFDEVQARTKELAASLDDLRTAQDRLVQTEKLASLGQLTAGIAHEIKNPLNFVNNFSALSAELTDELNDILKSAALGEKMREEVDELTGLLKDNLEKVVQHGKRADSIVKNMLLHSREGTGEHRPADINALLDESLNLAYHGARAEKSEFSITLQRDFDPNAGTVELFPQEITRAFLNLISNGFYAATKRKTENGGSGFEPVLRASTKNLGNSVEIRIHDNGTGIPTDVKEKMFNPFFTTKPAGQGTGLGLSMSHDIIVKQHGGSIDVETEPGFFTEFKIVLPRTSQR
jgi:two-component system, NtrC family, sensor kinase